MTAGSGTGHLGQREENPKRRVCVCVCVCVCVWGRQSWVPVGIACVCLSPGEAFSPAFDARPGINHSK